MAVLDPSHDLTPSLLVTTALSTCCLPHAQLSTPICCKPQDSLDNLTTFDTCTPIAHPLYLTSLNSVFITYVLHVFLSSWDDPHAQQACCSPLLIIFVPVMGLRDNGNSTGLGLLLLFENVHP
jgi:hypothetical protein